VVTRTTGEAKREKDLVLEETLTLTALCEARMFIALFPTIFFVSGSLTSERDFFPSLSSQELPDKNSRSIQSRRSHGQLGNYSTDCEDRASFQNSYCVAIVLMYFMHMQPLLVVNG
jgi:hypothetical protein